MTEGRRVLDALVRRRQRLRLRRATSIWRLVGRRVFAAIPVMLGVSVLTFFVLDVMPGNAAEQLLGADATPQQVARLEVELNLDRPAPERYRRWMVRVLAGDLGQSLASRQPIGVLIAERLPVTLELVAYAFALAFGLAVPTGLLAARYPNGLVDRTSAAAAMVALSLPSYVQSVLLVLAFAVFLPLFPAIGFTPIDEDLSRNLWSLTLPAAALAVPLFGLYARFLRADLLQQIRREPYVITATAKGVGPWRVLIRHVLRNSSPGLVTIVGLNVGNLIGGTVIVEQIFALPGLGQLLLQSVNTRDIPAVQGIVLVLATATVVASLCVDLLYAVLDPRVRYE